MKCLKIKFYEFIIVSIILYTDNSSDYAICRQHVVKKQVLIDLNFQRTYKTNVEFKK